MFYEIRRFEDEQDRIARYADTYEDPQWTDDIRPHARRVCGGRGGAKRRRLD